MRFIIYFVLYLHLMSFVSSLIVAGAGATGWRPPVEKSDVAFVVARILNAGVAVAIILVALEALS